MMSPIQVATFIGGPYDGWPLTDEDTEYPIHTFDFTPGLMVVYGRDENGRFSFVKICPSDDVANKAENEDRGVSL